MLITTIFPFLDHSEDITKEDFPTNPGDWQREKEKQVFAMLNYSRQRLSKDAQAHLQRQEQAQSTSGDVADGSLNILWSNAQEINDISFSSDSNINTCEDGDQRVFDVRDFDDDQ